MAASPPQNIGTNHNTGENILFIGCAIGNNYGAGLFVETGFEVNVSLVSCSLDQNTSWAIVNGTSAGGNAVYLTDTYIFSEQPWILNYGYINITAPGYRGTNVSTFLMDNEGVMIVNGRVWCRTAARELS